MGKKKLKFKVKTKVKREETEEPKEYSIQDLSENDVDALLHRAESGKLKPEDIKVIKWGFKTLSWLYQVLEFKKVSINRLRKLLFGPKSEKSSDILKGRDEGEKSEGSNDSKDSQESELESQSESSEVDNKPKRKGHGHNGASDYPGAEIKFIEHGSLRPGDTCPECLKAKLYEYKRPGIIIRIRGSAPIKAIIFKLQKLRCSSCQMLFTAELPPEAGDNKYDAESGTMVALLKYGNGFPFYRLGKFQKDQGIPLPPSTQWDMIKTVFRDVNPVYSEIERLAAQGDVFYNDDTGAKVQSIIREKKKAEKKGEKLERVGIFTSGIVSEVEGHKIALYYTGRNHAGENLDNLLDLRPDELDVPIQMSDALEQNNTSRNKTSHYRCLLHGRRKFVDLINIFPPECIKVIKCLRDVYKNDEETKEQNMTPRERLLYHQRKSGPLMEELKQWFDEQFEKKLIEENSSLGEAIKYMQKNWEKLTGFLKIENCPLDSNAVERCLKRFILSRKNSYFYKTENGALVGGVLMSIIETCHLENVNPFKYITALQKHQEQVKINPSKWLPWNYEKMIPTEG